MTKVMRYAYGWEFDNVVAVDPITRVQEDLLRMNTA